MAGPSIDVATPGEIHVAWMSDGEVYRATSRDGGRTFSARAAPLSRGGGRRTLPLVVSGSGGEQLFAWVENRRALWERIGADGRVVAAGDNGRLSQDTKVAAEIFQKQLRDEDPAKRARVVASLGDVAKGNAQLIAVLKKSLEDPSPTVRSAAKQALFRAGELSLAIGTGVIIYRLIP